MREKNNRKFEKGVFSWIYLDLDICSVFSNILKSRVIKKIMKRDEIKKYSNPDKVMKIAKKLGLNPVEISTRKDKKYMIYDNNGDVKHFGQMLYHDYTKTNDKSKLDAFMNRNNRWYHAPKYSPAWLSAYLLWNPDY